VDGRNDGDDDGMIVDGEEEGIVDGRSDGDDDDGYMDG